MSTNCTFDGLKVKQKCFLLRIIVLVMVSLFSLWVFSAVKCHSNIIGAPKGLHIEQMTFKRELPPPPPPASSAHWNAIKTFLLVEASAFIAGIITAESLLCKH